MSKSARPLILDPMYGSYFDQSEIEAYYREKMIRGGNSIFSLESYFLMLQIFLRNTGLAGLPISDPSHVPALIAAAYTAQDSSNAVAM